MSELSTDACAILATSASWPAADFTSDLRAGAKLPGACLLRNETNCQQASDFFHWVVIA